MGLLQKSARLCVSALLGFGAVASAVQATHHARLTVLLSHSERVYSVAFSPDGQFVLTGEDNTSHLWDTVSGKELQQFVGHSKQVNSVAFSPDGRYVLTGSADTTARLWNASSGEEVRQFVHSQSVNSVAFSPDGRYVLTGSADTTARLWNASSGEEIRRFVHSQFVNSVAFSPDGRYVLTGSGKTARLWNASGGEEVRQFVHSQFVNSVAFSPDGRYVLTGSGRGFRSEIDDSAARLWDAASGNEVRRFKGNFVVRTVTFSRNSQFLLTGGNDGVARLWNVDTGEELRQFGEHNPPSSLSNPLSFALVGFSPDGRYVLTSKSFFTKFGITSETRLWDAINGKEVHRFEGHSDGIRSVAFSLNGKYLVTGSDDGITWLWETTNGKRVRRFEGNSGITSVTLSSDGRYVLAVSQDQTARVWDASTGKEIFRLARISDPILPTAFSPDGRFVLLGNTDNGKNIVQLWDCASGEEVQRFEGHSQDVSSVAFSPDDRYVLTGSYDKTARLWDRNSGLEIRRFEGYSEVYSVAFSPDGRFVLTGHEDKTARLWDAASGKELHRFEGHSAPVLAAVFSPDGRFVMTGSLDKTARLWDTTNGGELRRFESPSVSVSVWTLAFSADGRYVMAAVSDLAHGTFINAGSGLPAPKAEIWDIETGKTLASLITFRDGGWAEVDPAGHYDASDPDNSSSLYWVTDNLRIIDLGQLKKEYYTPALLARVLHGERLPDVTGMDTVALPPVVSVAAEYNPSSWKLKVDIKNDGGGVGKLLVKVNDRLVRIIDNPGLPPPEGTSMTLPIDLSDAPLVPGDNTIRVTVYESTNRIESHEAVAHYSMAASARGVTLVPEPMTTGNTGRFFAIVVGTSKFGDPKMNLTFPAKDAESVATGLRLGAERLYGKDHVWMRVLNSNAKSDDELPTKKNIRAAFAQVRRQARPEDTLVVYLSGHGTMSSTNRDLYYYLTADARTLDVDTDSTLRDVSTLSSAELFEWLREPVKTMPLKQVVILDTCAAGGASGELIKLAEKRDIPPDQRRAIELLKDATGTFILMGSAADSVSYEASKYGEGLLTYALLQGMRGESLDDGSRLGVSRWFEKASEDVPDLARSIGGIQKPVIAAPKGRGFPVGLLTSEDRGKIPLALPKPQLLRVACEDENGLDPLHLRNILREQMRALNFAQTSGDAADDAQVMYLDAIDDDLPGAILPKLRYTLSGDRVTVEIRLVLDDKRVADDTVIASSTDTNKLAAILIRKIVSMAVVKR